MVIASLGAMITRVNPLNESNRPLEASRSSYDSSFPSVGPTVFVDPSVIIGSMNDLITLSVKVFNLTDATIPDPSWPFYQIPLGNLWSFSLNFTWDPSILEYVSHTVTIPKNATYPDGVLNSPAVELLEIVDPTTGLYHIQYSSQFGAEPFNNPGASNKFFNMTFKVISLGSSDLTLPSTGLRLYDYPDFVPIGEGTQGEKVYLNIENGLFKTVGPGETAQYVYVTTKPNNQQGILYLANVTAFNGSDVIISGISNTSGIVALTNVTYGNITFVAYAKSDYSQVIANITVFISEEGQSFDLLCDQNYGEGSISWNSIIVMSLSTLTSSLPLSMFSSRMLTREI